MILMRAQPRPLGGIGNWSMKCEEWRSAIQYRSGLSNQLPELRIEEVGLDLSTSIETVLLPSGGYQTGGGMGFTLPDGVTLGARNGHFG